MFTDTYLRISHLALPTDNSLFESVTASNKLLAISSHYKKSFKTLAPDISLSFPSLCIKTSHSQLKRAAELLTPTAG